MATANKKRIWGWMLFDWASQPFYTLGLTFIFGPYFAVVATAFFLTQGLDDAAARAQSQSTWAFGQTCAGLFIAITAPFLGAFADSTGRKRPWIALFSIIYVVGAASLWFMQPDTSSLILFLVLFYVGFIAAESALNFINAYLPSLGNDDEVGRISGSGASFGYWGGLISLILMLVFFAESGDSGKTIVGMDPIFGLDPAMKEGTRSVGPFIAIWYIIFIIPFFLWVKDVPADASNNPTMSKVLGDLKDTLVSVGKHKSTAMFLISGMFYRDALNALYAFGGVYATLVLGWTVAELGPFGIISVITAAVFTYVGGRFDSKIGPMPVIRFCVYMLILVCIVIVGMSREGYFGIPFPADSSLPDIIFFVCGSIIGGAGGALYAASRSMMSRHGHPERPTEAFGLFALSGKATAFLAPFLIGIFTLWTGSVQLGFLPVIILFILGLILLRWVNKDGDRAEWGRIGLALFLALALASCGSEKTQTASISTQNTGDTRVAKALFGAAAEATNQSSQAVGGYARGCQAGAVQLAETGPTWQAMRLSRNRNWAQPTTVSFVQDLSQFAATQSGWRGLYVGDMSQPRGGPMLTGHRSHQSGLDADIWMLPPDRLDLNAAERESLSSISMRRERGAFTNTSWSPQHEAILKRAASDPRVARIFVFPGAKVAMCNSAGTDRDWLRKIRPWWGHHYHFHVRLNCPEGDSGCQNQAPPPAGDGCADAQNWVDDILNPPPPDLNPRPPRGPLTMGQLPAQCHVVLNAE